MSGSHYDTCDVDSPLANQTAGECRSRSTVGEVHSGALALFVISEILQGMAVAPMFTMSMTYIDDNVKEQSPAHIGEIPLTLLLILPKKVCHKSSCRYPLFGNKVMLVTCWSLSQFTQLQSFLYNFCVTMQKIP